MTNKLEELKKEMEKAEAACDALDATYAARFAAREALDTLDAAIYAARAAVCDANTAALDAYKAYNKELNKNNDK